MKIKWQVVERGMQVIQCAAIVAGVYFAVVTLQESGKLESARFVLKIGHYLDNARYDKISEAIEGDDKIHDSNYPILRKSGGKFRPSEVDSYLGPYFEIGSLYEEDLIDDEMVYEFSYDFEKLYCNKDIWNYVLSERKKSGDMDSPNAFYAPIEVLAKKFLKDDHYNCTDLDKQ